MSASLVGSEMCIRDSCTIGPVEQRPISRMVGTAARYCSRQRSTLSQYAVSYTHLTLPTICSV
eukprot:12966267-Alexandrium_andersonii.AAC.1